MKRYNLCNISEDAIIKSDCYGDWCRFEEVRSIEKERDELLQNWLEEREEHHELKIRYELLLAKIKLL